MNRKRRLLCGMIMLLLLTGMTTAVYAEDEVDNPDFTVSVEAGLDSVVLEDAAAPVTVTIGNSGQDFSGVLRLIVSPDYYANPIAYEKIVTVPSGGEKSISILIPDIGSGDSVIVQLETEKGKLLYSHDVDLKTVTAGQNAIVGILSSDYSALNAFDSITIDTGYATLSTRTLRLTADNLPETGEGLSACHYIVIDNYHTSQLSEEQRNAIVSWVASGGTLIFGTGSKAATVLEGFQDTLAQVTVNGLSKQTITITDSYGEAQTVDAASITADGWQDMQTSIASGAPAWKTGYGSGSVLILSYDMGMEPLVSAGEADELAANILEAAATDNSLYTIAYGGTTLFDSYTIGDAVAAVDGNRVPSTLLYAGIFLVYVICIGPVMYLILKAKDKREWMWVGMPAIAVVFTLVVAGSSMIYRIHKPFVDAVTIVDYADGSSTTTAYMAIQSPKSKAYTVQLADGYQNVQYYDNSNYYAVSESDYQAAVRLEGTTAELRFKRGTAFTEYNLAARKENGTGVGAGLETNLTCQIMDVGGTTANACEGSVTNNTGYALENVVLCYGDVYVYLGEMAQGETRSFAASDLDLLSNVYYDMSNWMAETTDTADQYLTRAEKRKLNVNQYIYQAMESEVNNMDLGQGMVFGMIKDYDEELVQGSNTKVYNAAIARTSFYQMVEEYQAYSVFINDINEYLVGGDNIDYDASYPEGYDYFYYEREMYDAEMETLYDFQTLDTTGAQLVMLDYTDSSATSGYGEVLTDTEYVAEVCKVQLYNYTTQTYDDVFTSSDTVEDLTPYLNEENWMQVRYYGDDPYESYTAPQLMLIGGEQ